MSIGQQCRAAGFWGRDLLQGGPVRRHLSDIIELASNTNLREEVTHVRLQDLFRHATSTTQRYAPFAGAVRLTDFPILQKTEIREQQRAFLSRAFAPAELSTVRTSGSYGTPLSFWLTKDKRARQFADLLHFTGWIGWKIGMRYLQVRARNPGRLHMLVHNERVVDPTHMTPDWFRRGRRLLRESGVRFLMGYPSAIHALAEYCREQGDDRSSFQLVGACLGGEPLTPTARRAMEATFGCPVRSRYAANELGVLGQEPKEDPGRHVLNACSYVYEVLCLDRDEPAPAGQMGRLVVTDLFSHALPLIRYDTGDLGVLSARPVPGTGMPVLDCLEGRQTDVIFDPEGNRLCNLRLFDIPTSVQNLVRFQLVQVEPARYLLRCIVLPGFDQDAELGERMKAALGPGAEVVVERVPEIAPLASGKRPAILNRMAK